MIALFLKCRLLFSRFGGVYINRKAIFDNIIIYFQFLKR